MEPNVARGVRPGKRPLGVRLRQMAVNSVALQAELHRLEDMGGNGDFVVKGREKARAQRESKSSEMWPGQKAFVRTEH